MPALITLSNATRPRLSVGARARITADPFGSHSDAVALLEPLGLEHRLGRYEVDDLRALAAETQAIAEALVSNRRPPPVSTLNRLAGQATASQTLRVGPDGTLTADVRWHAATAVVELACQVVAEFGRLDPARLRRCAREPCDLLSYDTTRSRTQRWHSESPCGVRERQERWRHAVG
ncbi:MAG TPA: CGNR zinc finger domain-containing protein [Solirubrobacteraceae bacterium]|nr:CGNR zinc finger domain-containing protein [Solirubrobacteraceae bacterium]